MVKTKFKQTEIGLIPEDWEVEVFTDIFDFLSTASYSRANLKSSGNIGYIHYGDIHTKIGYHLNTNKYVSGYISKEQLKNYSIVQQGDLIIADASEDYHGVGKGFEVINIPEINIIAGLHTFLIREKESKLALGFKAYFHSNPLIKKQYDALASGLKVYSLPKSAFKNIQIPLPPLPEQQAIAKALSDTDAWIESLEKLIDKKRLIKQGAMQDLLTPKEEWGEVMLGDVCDFYKGKGLPKKDLIPDGHNECIHYGELFTTYNETILNIKSRTNIKENVILSKENDVLMPTSDVTPNGLATASCINKDGVILGGDILIIRLYENFNGVYLAYFITNNKNKVMEFVTGSTVYHIYGSELKNLKFNYPTYIEQTHIASILSDMDAEIEALENKLRKAQQLKQGMMQELLTGRIRLVESTEMKKVEPKPTKGHNDQFNDAVLIATMASVFGSDKFPLTRFKYTKVSYLLKRYKEEQDAGYLKHAAGPYKPKTRYGGAEKIAINKKYIDIVATNYKGKEYEGFVASENVDEAIKYFEDWYGTDALKWIKQYKFEKNDNLELWATVDMAIEDLKKKDEIITVSTIKQVLKENKEWKDKLKRSIFSDINIQKAIIKLETLFT